MTTIQDPRPDFAADHPFWLYLLQAAVEQVPVLVESLYALRCLGARLEATQRGLRLVSGDIELPVWYELRREFVIPHNVELTTLLKEWITQFKPPEPPDDTPISLETIRERLATQKWPELLLADGQWFPDGETAWKRVLQVATVDELVQIDAALTARQARRLKQQLGQAVARSKL